MLTNSTIKLLDDNGIKVHDKNKRGRSHFYREIEFHSPLGEDVVEVVWYDGTDEGFIESFSELANNFDVDEHVEPLIRIRGTRGVPKSIEALVNDAKEIREKLVSVAEILSNSV